MLLLAIAVPAAPAQDERRAAVSASDQMKYDTTDLSVKKGGTLIITLTNNGTLPKAAMAHNLVVLKPGTDTTAFVMAAMSHRADDYLPPDQSDKVVTATKLLGPGESDTIIFHPTEAGSYPFVCTFPGHAQSGMRGTITVQ